MPRPELGLFSYEVMGLVGRDGAGPHDLLRMARRGRILDWAGESQYYVEPKRLAKQRGDALPGGVLAREVGEQEAEQQLGLHRCDEQQVLATVRQRLARRRALVETFDQVGDVVSQGHARSVT